MKDKHDGDCWVYAVKICTCGFFHEVSIKPDSEEFKKHEDAIFEHQNILHQLNQKD